MNEIIFIVKESPEGGYEGKALGFSIFVEGDRYSIRSVFNKKYKLIWNLDSNTSYFNKYIMNASENISWENAAHKSEMAENLILRFEKNEN